MNTDQPSVQTLFEAVDQALAERDEAIRALLKVYDAGFTAQNMDQYIALKRVEKVLGGIADPGTRVAAGWSAP